LAKYNMVARLRWAGGHNKRSVQRKHAMLRLSTEYNVSSTSTPSTLASLWAQISQSQLSGYVATSAIGNDENGCRHMCFFLRIFINNFF